MSWKYFTKDEMKCSHCGKVAMDETFMAMLDKARELAGIPFVIVSGYRCQEYDNQIRGEGNHPQGKAADIRTTNGYERARVLQGLILAGFARIGISTTFIHVDTCANRPTPCVFLYQTKE